MRGLRIVILGLSITSSWGNGHATTYRGLVRHLARRGHAVTFLERDVPWYAGNRDLPDPPYGKTYLYSDLRDLERRFAEAVHTADLTIVGSFVPDGVAVAEWALATGGGLVAFYDIDTPVTLAGLARGDSGYLTPDLIPRFHMYLSFTGGPTLGRLESDWGSPMARALYCSVDPALYYPEPAAPRWDLGYLGTYSEDRQAKLDALLAGPAQAWPEGRFVVAGPQYPESIRWPENVERVEHLPPDRHRTFYNGQRYALNVTRADMVAAGWSPSVRLFEAAACGTAIVSDPWPGIDELFVPGVEILLAETTEEALAILRDVPDARRAGIGAAARSRVLSAHTGAHRVAALEEYVREAALALRRRRVVELEA